MANPTERTKICLKNTQLCIFFQKLIQKYTLPSLWNHSGSHHWVKIQIGQNLRSNIFSSNSIIGHQTLHIEKTFTSHYVSIERIEYFRLLKHNFSLNKKFLRRPQKFCLPLSFDITNFEYRIVVFPLGMCSGIRWAKYRGN